MAGHQVSKCLLVPSWLGCMMTPRQSPHTTSSIFIPASTATLAESQRVFGECWLKHAELDAVMEYGLGKGHPGNQPRTVATAQQGIKARRG